MWELHYWYKLGKTGSIVYVEFGCGVTLMKKPFDLPVISTVAGVLIGFLVARGWPTRQPSNTQTLFDRNIRCQQVARQAERDERSDYDFLMYDDIGYSAKRDSCVASVISFKRSMQMWGVVDLLSGSILWSDSCFSGKDCGIRESDKIQKEQRAKF